MSFPEDLARVAADLPEGSIVASRNAVYLKAFDSGATDWPWVVTQFSTPIRDRGVDELLADGAMVLRHGYGEGQS